MVQDNTCNVIAARMIRLLEMLTLCESFLAGLHLDKENTMAEKTGQNPCNIADLQYPHGSIVCGSGKCELCTDGVWKATGELCPCWNQGVV